MRSMLFSGKTSVEDIERAVLEQNAEADTRAYMAVKAVLIASLNNFPPAAAVEFGRKVLFSYQRPTFAELDEGTKAVKGK